MRERFEIGPVAKLAIVAGAGAMAMGACGSDNDSGPRELNLPSEEVENICDPENRTPAGDFLGTIGAGVYASNEAMEAEVTSDEDIRTEFVEDLLGNVPGIALLNAQLDQQGSASYRAASTLIEATNRSTEFFKNAGEYSAACNSVIGEIQSNSEYEKEFEFADGVRITNEYDDSDTFTGYKVTEISGRTVEEGLIVRNPNEEIIFIINPQGEFILPKDNGPETGSDESGSGVDQQNPDLENGEEEVPADVIITEDGVEVPVTWVITPEGEEIPVTTNPDTGEQTPVDPVTGEPTGEPVPTGSVPAPTGGSGGEPDGSGPSHSGPGTSQPGTVDTEPGVTTGPTTTVGGPGTTTPSGPTTTVGGPGTTTPSGTTTTTTQPEETTTTTQPEETTTTQPEETTTTTSTTEPTPTTTKPPKGTVPETTEPVEFS
jgi:hypothetical protein